MGTKPFSHFYFKAHFSNTNKLGDFFIYPLALVFIFVNSLSYPLLNYLLIRKTSLYIPDFFSC